MSQAPAPEGKKMSPWGWLGLVLVALTIGGIGINMFFTSIASGVAEAGSYVSRNREGIMFGKWLWHEFWVMVIWGIAITLLVTWVLKSLKKEE